MKLSTRKSFIFAVLLGAFAFIGGTGLTVSSAWLITMASQHPPILVLGVAIVMVRFFGIFRSVARYGERVISHEAIFRKLTGIRVQLFASMADALRTDSFTIARKSKAIIDDVERAQEFHLRVTLPGASSLLAGVVTIGLGWWIDQTLLLWVLPAYAIFAFLIPFMVKRYLDPIAIQIEDHENIYSSEISAASHAMVEAEIFGYSEHYQSGLAQRSLELGQLERAFNRRSSIVQFISVITLGATLAGIANSFQHKPENLAIHIAMSLLLVLVGFEGFTSWFPNLFISGKNRRASQGIEALSQVAHIHTSLGGSPSSSDLKAMGVSPFWREKFLKPASFEINRGEVLLITGPSGIGKSTLVAAMLGFADYEGSMKLGGVEIREIDEISRFISGTLQQGHIFNTTMRENLKISNSSATDGELLRIVKAMELDSISLDEVLGEYGRKISGGEAKRLSTARALLSPAPIVILDEPLEHLDHERAGRIQEAILESCREKSLIVITHSPWSQYSRKLELERE